MTYYIVAGLLNGDKSTHDAVTSMMSEIRQLQDIIEQFKLMQVDATEYAYLKGIILFRTGEFRLYVIRHALEADQGTIE